MGPTGVRGGGGSNAQSAPSLLRFCTASCLCSKQAPVPVDLEPHSTRRNNGQFDSRLPQRAAESLLPRAQEKALPPGLAASAPGWANFFFPLRLGGDGACSIVEKKMLVGDPEKVWRRAPSEYGGLVVSESSLLIPHGL